MKDLIIEQTENFEIHEQVINNLTNDEKILYKLKTVKRSKWSKNRRKLTFLLILLTIMIPIIRVSINIIRGEDLIDDITLFSTIMMLIVLIIWHFLSKDLFTPTDYYLFITNKKIFIIIESNPGTIIDIINLKDIQCISFKNRQLQRDGSENAEIEIISLKIYEDSKGLETYSYRFPIKYDLFHVKNIIESILWHYTMANQRIIELKEELGIQIPHKFSDTKQRTQIQLFNNGVHSISENSLLEIEFSEKFYLNYESWSFKSGFIIIQPDFNSPSKIKFKIQNNYYALMELIYFLWLSWKDDKHFLIDVNNLEKRSQIFKEDLAIEKEILDFKPDDYSQEVLKPFNEYLSKDEKILLFYFTKLSYFKLVVSIILLIIGLFSIYFMNYLINFMFNLSFISLSLLSLSALGISLTVIIPIWLSRFLSQKFKKYLFTTQKIIVKRYGKMSFTHYSNISSISYDNRKKYQHIKINLKTGLSGGEFEGKRIILISYIPLEMKLFRKIKYLKDNFSNKV